MLLSVGFVSDVSSVFKDSAVLFGCTPHGHYSGLSVESEQCSGPALKGIAAPVWASFRNASFGAELRTLHTDLGAFSSSLVSMLYILWLPGRPFLTLQILPNLFITITTIGYSDLKNHFPLCLVKETSKWTKYRYYKTVKRWIHLKKDIADSFNALIREQHGLIQAWKNAVF